MKKITLLIITIFTFSFSNAQRIEFGVKAGLNVGNIVSTENRADSKVGFHLSGFSEVKLTEKFYIQPEILYSRQGATAEETATISGVLYNGKVDLKLTYIYVPLVAKYYVLKDFSLEAGPQIGFLTSAKADAEISAVGGGPVIKQSRDLKEKFNTVDFGLNFGLGYKFAKNFSATGRYNHSLLDLNKESTNREAVKNAVVQISLGYTF